MLLSLTLLAAGIAILTAGGWFLVKGASSLAVVARISLPVIGLTVVAMGTSLPELAVSVSAAAAGSTDMAYGNIVGSNIFNIAIVLAVAGLISGVPVTRQVFKVEYPFMFLVTLLVIYLASDGHVGHAEGAGLVILLALFTWYMVRTSREMVTTDEVSEFASVSEMAGEGSGARWVRYALYVLLGIVGLAGGARLMVAGAVRIAELYGVSERIIGLTILAMGTSLPEVATTVIAAYRREHDLVVGNIIGSNIFNLLGILGVTAIIFPVPVPEMALSFDNWVMLAFSALLFPILWFRSQVSKRDGALLLGLFAVYMWFLLNR